MPAFASPLRRRTLLRATAIAGGGLLVACRWSGSGGGREEDIAATATESWQPNAFIRISADNFVTILVAASEIGQGVGTALPMIIAEELDANWERVSWEHSPASAVIYGNPFWQREAGEFADQAGLQITAASTSVRGYYQRYREAGAAVRDMLLSAAASRLGVAKDSLTTRNSFVIHAPSSTRLSYGELAAAAAAELPPLQPPLKDPAQFRIIGQSKRRLDASEKSDGSLQYGFDMSIPDMLTVLVVRPPVFGATVLTYDDSAAMQVPGVVSVHQVPSGVAVAARDFWSAERGRNALQINWSTLTGEKLNTSEQRQLYQNVNRLPGRIVRNDGLGDLPQLAGESHAAEYFFPYLAHAPMEPLSVVIDYRGDSCEIWCGSQWPDMDRLVAATVLGLPVAAVEFHTLMSGGGFGRRACLGFDYIQEAAHVARAVGAPLKLVWTREDDIHGGFYRPYSACRLSATHDGTTITSWRHRTARQSLLVSPLVETVTALVTEEVQTTQGATEMPYAIDNVRVEAHAMENGVPVLWMRSVANAVNVFAVETFFDELAAQLGREPLALRRELLQEKRRHLAVLDACAEAIGWDAPAPAGVFRGIATCTSYGSYIAQAVEASAELDGNPDYPGKYLVTIHRIVSVVDCGVAVNPDLVEAQIESAVVFALSSALFGEITLADGVVQQSNFHDYPILRMYQTPTIETVIVPSSEAPGGIGELGVPCVAPALVNALFAATGKAFHSLPLNGGDLHFR